MDIATAEIGQHEIAGAKANPRIVEYHSSTWLKATSDEVPWCSSFVNWCLIKAVVRPTRSAAAKSWLTWGEETEPRLGAIVVIRKDAAGVDPATGSLTGYHVGFFVAKGESHIRLLGGNQGDSVKESAFPLSVYSVVGMRWPVDEIVT